MIDTIADLAGATNYALQECGFPTHETDAYRYFVGNGINKLFERALPENERSEANILKYVLCLYLIIIYTMQTLANPIRV